MQALWGQGWCWGAQASWGKYSQGEAPGSATAGCTEGRGGQMVEGVGDKAGEGVRLLAPYYLLPATDFPTSWQGERFYVTLQ